MFRTENEKIFSFNENFNSHKWEQVAQHYKALGAEMGFEPKIPNSWAHWSFLNILHACKKPTLIPFLTSYQQMEHSPS